MMTKQSLAALVIICLLVACGAYIYSLKAAASLGQPANLTQLAARREDLLASNAKLAQAIVQLNQTLAAELNAQKVLAAEVAALSRQVNLPAGNDTASLPSPTPAPVPAPAPIPVYRPVTRAS
jgi:hypothetical protein